MRVITWFGRLLLALSAATVVTFAAAGTASAASYTVTTTNDSNDGSCTPTLCSLRDAVVAADAAGGASTITVPAGIYKLTIASTGANDPTNGDLDINNNANVTINGAGSGSTIIDGNNLDRQFAVQTGASLTLSGMTLRTGQPASSSSGNQDGGAIYTDGGLTVGNANSGTSGDVVFLSNTSENGGNYDGGAIYADSNSTVSLTGATFDNNSADDYGGAIYDGSSHLLTITKSLFKGNQATDDDGGAIYGVGDGGGLAVDSTTFVANEAPDGGAIYWDTNTDVSITHSTFNGNQTYSEGGAIYDNDSSSMTANYDTFINNAGPYDGGALFLGATSTTAYTFNHDLFSGNIANDDYGGAIYWELGSLTSNDSTYANNQASYGDEGGALYATSGGSLTLINDTITRNSSGDSDGGAIYVETTTPASLINDTITSNNAYQGDGGGIYGTGSLTTTGYTGSGTAGIENTVISNNNGGDCNSQFAAPFDLGHNLDSDGSCFASGNGNKPSTEPALGPLADNGGPLAGNQTDGSAQVIPTQAETLSSPTLDSGTNTGCPATDERGVPRPQGASCDMGAFEAAAAALGLRKDAPSSATAGSAFTYTITVTNNGPGYSTGTAVGDQLPSGETFYGASPSQGSCTASGTPAKVSCALGTIAPSGTATISLVVSAASPGRVTNTAVVTNDQGASTSASATTTITAVAAAALHKPTAITGKTTGTTRHSTTLHGKVNPRGTSTSYFFEYKPVGSSSWRVTTISGTRTAKGVTTMLRGLAAGTRYRYRLVATNGAGTSYGAIRTFRTRGVRARARPIRPRFTG